MPATDGTTLRPPPSDRDPRPSPADPTPAPLRADDRPPPVPPPDRPGRADLLCLAFLTLTVVIFFADTLVGGRVMLPIDNLYRFEPWSSLAAARGVGEPHNNLIGDAILQNVAWKTFARDHLTRGALPLWNPYEFAGLPFLAGGQSGSIYPLGVVFYALPVLRAYGWFLALHLWLAGVLTYAFLRAHHLRPIPALVGALAFAYCTFLIVSFTWPMIVSAAVWLPALLLALELLLRAHERRHPLTARLPPLVLGALTVALQTLAGHLEITFYVLATAALYTLARLLLIATVGAKGGEYSNPEGERAGNPLSRGVEEGRGGLESRVPAKRVAVAVRVIHLAAPTLECLALPLLGLLLAAVQLLPFFELIGQNVRSGNASYREVISYALPIRQLGTFLLPELYGSPTRHAVFDLTIRAWRDVGSNALGQPTDPPGTIFWGIKNYVEGGSYLGILPLLAAAIALLAARTRLSLIVAAIAAISLAFAFGTPLYRVLFFGVPGFDQLHTPFRWILPWSFATAVLAAAGLDAALPRPGRPPARAPRLIGLAALAFGLVALAALAVVALAPGPVLELAGRALRRSDRLLRAYPDAAMLLSHQWRNLAVGAAALAASGAALLALRRGGRLAWLAPLVLTADLFVAHYDFNTRADPALLVEPPVVTFLKQQPGPFRIASFGPGDALKPITPMLFGVEDIRGYDTVITRPFATYWSQFDETGDLLYSMLHKLYRPSALDSPYLAALNVRYVLSTQPIDRPGLELVFDGSPKVYRLGAALPRALVVGEAFVAGDDAEALALVGAVDLRRGVVLTDPGAAVGVSRTPSLPTPEPVFLERGTDRVRLRVAGGGGHLVLFDAYDPGWRATVDGAPAQVHRANYLFRSVAVPPGDHVVELRYRPLSLQLGAALSLLGALALAGLAGAWLWRTVLAAGPDSAGRRVARNSVVPLATQLATKTIDLAFAFVMLRVLQPEGTGKYAFAAILVGYVEIFANFGLNALVIREVARAPERARDLVGAATSLRLILWLVALPVLGTILIVSTTSFGLARDTATAAALLMLALVPGQVAAALSSYFYARERMEVPAVVAVCTTLVRVALGLVVLALGFGFVGLAAVALVANALTATIFFVLVARRDFVPGLRGDVRQFLAMARESYPLMLNHLLATIFFRVDVILLQSLRGERELGFYATGFKYVDGLLIIPSTFTFALFPMLSRLAAGAPDQMLRAYRLGLRLLLVLALPISIAVFAAAEPLILLAGGPSYLPDAAIALRVLIWFLPFSFINGLTQYVLIAAGQQRTITIAFVVAVAFNLAANLLLIPRYGYVAAAAVTVASEWALLVPFARAVRRHVGPLDWPALARRPLLAALAMLLTLALLSPQTLSIPPSSTVPSLPAVPLYLTLLLALAVYLAALLLLRVLHPDEAAALNRLAHNHLAWLERWHPQPTPLSAPSRSPEGRDRR